MWQELKKAHFICSVRICSRLQQALDERDGATEAACQEQRCCSTESTGVDISPSLVNISIIASVVSTSTIHAGILRNSGILCLADHDKADAIKMKYLSEKDYAM
jgi:3,4-dihydroxy-2-butanone 4-phosphate synthase